MPELTNGLTRVGPSDERVRRYLQVKRGRGPDRGSRIALEGAGLVEAALEAGAGLEAVFVCPEFFRGEVPRRLTLRLADVRVPTLRVAERVFSRMVGRDGPDGVAATCALRVATLGDLRPRRTARVLVVDAPERPGNLGSLIRSADAADAHAVIVTGGRLRLHHPMVAKASMGALFSLPVVPSSPGEAFDWLRGHRFTVVAGDAAAADSYRDAHFGGRVALVVGSERLGLSSFWRTRADQLVSIPVLGVADSINVGHAGAILLYEALHRQSAGSPGRPGSPRRRQAPSASESKEGTS